MNREGLRRAHLGCASLLLLSCMSAVKWKRTEIEKVRKRASFDLACPADKLKFVELGHDKNALVTTVGAEGCERKATYVYISEGSGWALDVGQIPPNSAPAK